MTVVIETQSASYDLTPYEHVWDFAPASVDRRHLFWMYDVLCCGGFKNTLEIGCFYGASSTAFVEALNRELIGRATFCDIEIHPNLRSTLAHCQFPDRIQVYEGRSQELLKERKRGDRRRLAPQKVEQEKVVSRQRENGAEPVSVFQDEFDFVFVDGDHRLPAVAEEVELLIERRPVCVMAHDTNAQAAGFPDCDGPPLLKWRFMTTPPYMCLEDSAVRDGELTQRGMFLATTSKEVFDCAQQSLRKWGAAAGWPPQRVERK